MDKLKVFVIFGLIFLGSLLMGGSVSAVSPNVVISQVQIGETTQSRLIELYNNSNAAVDMTNWCLYRDTLSGSSLTQLMCFGETTSDMHYVLPQRSYAVIGSDKSTIQTVFSIGANTLGSTDANRVNGSLFLRNDQHADVDRVDWSSDNQKGMITPVQGGNGYVLERKHDPNLANGYIDTDDSANDFFNSNLRVSYTTNSVLELSDVCKNLDGLQIVPPSGDQVSADGNCTPIDVCSNIDGVQSVPPNGYETVADGTCEVVGSSGNGNSGVSADTNVKPLYLSELLPDAEGLDDGHEFIEIYNPNSTDVSLGGYSLQMGTNSVKSYDLPGDKVVPAGGYLAIYSSEINFSLLNDPNTVSLKANGGQILLDQTIYSKPSPGLSWSLIDGKWQYTNQLTPGAKNIMTVNATSNAPRDSSDSSLAPCPAGQYRNPSTNRCKKYSASSSTVLAPCQIGYYRNPTTNRCNKLTTSGSVGSCPSGYYRNPATNRCKKVSSSTSGAPKPCQAGYERNPTTNRCRKIAKTSVPNAKYAPKTTSNQSNNRVMWLSLSGVGLAATSYGVWEWRSEIAKIWQKIRGILRRK